MGCWGQGECCLTISVLSIANPHDVPVWNQLATIKSNILKRWDTAATGVRICCIKFVQKVVQVQTPGVIADPRVRNISTARSVERSADATLQRPDQNEVSIALVPRDHPLIPPPRLEPEASGLLDRLLNVFSEEIRYAPRPTSMSENSVLIICLK